jgi:hypothetical protein
MTHAAKVRHALQKLAIAARYVKEADAAIRDAVKVGHVEDRSGEQRHPTDRTSTVRGHLDVPTDSAR